MSLSLSREEAFYKAIKAINQFLDRLQINTFMVRNTLNLATFESGRKFYLETFKAYSNQSEKINAFKTYFKIENLRSEDETTLLQFEMVFSYCYD